MESLPESTQAKQPVQPKKSLDSILWLYLELCGSYTCITSLVSKDMQRGVNAECKTTTTLFKKFSALHK